MRRLPSSILVLVLGLAAPVRAYEESPSLEPGSEAPAAAADTQVGPIQPFVPPAVDYPGIIDLGPRLALHVDHTYEYTNDLSTFPWVQGRGNNYRVAVGGMYRFGNLQLRAEIPVQYTQLTLDTLMGQLPADSDRTKAAFSLGDVVTNGAYFFELPITATRIYVGLGLQMRLPTHTTRFRFGLMGGGTAEFAFPYYVHLAPAALLSASYGPFFLVVNQGALAMLAKDITIEGILQRIPDIYFWESHVASGLAATDWLAFTVELLGFVQLRRVAMTNMLSPDQPSVLDIRALSVNPGLTLDLGGFRLAVAGRIGLSGRSTRDFGVITFSGSHAVLTRLSYLF
jgi:hypothetical protein